VLSQRDEFFADEPDAQCFDALMLHVSRQFNVLPLADAIDRLPRGVLPSRALAVTFDDGYANNLTVAAPILRRHGVSATVFVSTAYLGNGCMWNDIVAEACRRTSLHSLDLGNIGLGHYRISDVASRRGAFQGLVKRLKYEPQEKRDTLAAHIADAAGVPIPEDQMLSQAGIRELHDQGFTIGAHTRTHPILTRTSTKTAWAEISEGRRELSEIVSRPIDLFAYPNGVPNQDYGMEHVNMVREAGFRAAVSTAWGAANPASDVFQLPRFTPWRTTPLQFDMQMMRNLMTGPEQRAT